MMSKTFFITNLAKAFKEKSFQLDVLFEEKDTETNYNGKTKSQEHVKDSILKRKGLNDITDKHKNISNFTNNNTKSNELNAKPQKQEV